MSDRKFSTISNSSEDPPHSRLFIIGSKGLTEDDYRRAFGEFGTIEEIWMVKDRASGDKKGVTYIKFSKTSEAAKALEAMNGKCIGNVNRSIKVMIAASRDQGSKRDENEEEKTLRLFVMVPKNMTDSELYDYFRTFGDIDYANVIKDRETKESKGFGYVKYFKFSHAATAFEQCDRKYKPVFAEPRKPMMRNDKKYLEPYESFTKSNVNFGAPLPNLNNDSYYKLSVIASPLVNQDQLWRLFDIVPGMDYCQLRYEGFPKPVRSVAEVVYTSSQWANHAKEKLHGFEYPPGYRLIVKADFDSAGSSYPSNRNSVSEKSKPDILQIAETIAQATSLIQAAGIPRELLHEKLGLSSPSTSRVDEVPCSVKLPTPQPMESIDTETEARCFIVCTPSPLPNSILKDVFCRFGSLIDVYMLNNRNCGYAKFASKESAEDAIKTLHGAEVCGIRLKVMEAEDRPGNNRKRPKLEESY